MTNERDLLELAAKACGIPIYEWRYNGLDESWHGARADSEEATIYWNPTRDPGDCKRMEAQLGIDTRWHDMYVDAVCWADQGDYAGKFEEYANHNGDKLKASMMAIVRAAAEIGKAMP